MHTGHSLLSCPAPPRTLGPAAEADFDSSTRLLDAAALRLRPASDEEEDEEEDEDEDELDEDDDDLAETLYFLSSTICWFCFNLINRQNSE